MKSEYEIWRDELAGRKPPLVALWQLLVFLAGMLSLIGFAFTHK